MQHASTQRKCTFVSGRFVRIGTDGEVWLSQVRIWHSVLISGLAELNWIARQEINAVFSHRLPTCSTSGMTSNSLFIFNSLSWVCVSMMSTYWLFWWCSQALVYKCGLVIQIQETHVREESDRLISQWCCYTITSFRFYSKGNKTRGHQ